MGGIIERILQASRLESKTFQMNMEKVRAFENTAGYCYADHSVCRGEGVRLSLEDWRDCNRRS